MAKDTKYGLQELRAEFPTDEACLEYLFDTLHTRECSCGGRYARMNGRKQFQCSKCRYQIAPMAGTIFQKTSTPLTLWFHAIFIFSNAKSGISAKEMERQLNVTYKCAYRILKLIRESLGQEKRKLKGTVEMDEGFFGGKGGGGEYNKNQKQVMAKKVKVMAAQERGGITRAEIVKDVSANSTWAFVRDNIERESTLMTDGSNHYKSATYGFDRKMVNHGKKIFVSGDAHVNNIENFWSHVKKSIRGTHKSVSKQHFQSYLDAFVWLRNNRHNDRMRFGALLGAIVK